MGQDVMFWRSPQSCLVVPLQMETDPVVVGLYVIRKSMGAALGDVSDGGTGRGVVGELEPDRVAVHPGVPQPPLTTSVEPKTLPAFFSMPRVPVATAVSWLVV